MDGAPVSKSRIRLASKLFPTLLALLASVVLVFTPFLAAGLACAALSIGVILWRSLRASFAATMPAQLLLTFGIIAVFPLAPGGQPTTGLAAAGTVLILLVVMQPTVNGIVNKPTLRVSNLPTYAAAGAIPIEPRLLYGGNVAAIALLGIFGVAGFSAWPIAVMLVVNAIAVAAVTATARGARRHNERTATVFHVAMEHYDPTFAVYFTAPGQHRVPRAHVAAVPASGSASRSW